MRPRRQLRAQNVVQRLREAQIHLEVQDAQNAAHQAAGAVRLVLGLRGRVVPLRQHRGGGPGSPGGATGGRARRRPAGASVGGGTEYDHHENAEQKYPQHHGDGALAVQKEHERREIGRVAGGARGDGLSEHDVIDHHLARPRHHQQAEERLHGNEAHLCGDARLEEPEVRGHPREHAQRLPQADVGARIQCAGRAIELLLRLAQGGFGLAPRARLHAVLPLVRGVASARRDSLASERTTSR